MQGKILTITSYNILEYLFKSKKISEKLKIKLFTTHIECIILYNSEQATLKKALEQQIDSFHRRMVRKVIGIHWPKRISNIDLYERTKENLWNTKIFKRRPSWLGHLLRLYKETSAQKALHEACKNTKCPRIRLILTWLKLVMSDSEKFSRVELDSRNIHKFLHTSGIS